MPIYTEEVAGDPFSDADLTFPTSEVLRATASEAFLDAPLLSAIPRAIELDVARRRYGGAYESFDRPAALGWLEKRGLTDKDLPLENRTYNELELSILARRKIAEIRRNQVLQGGEGGATETIARFGTALGVTVLDPLNVASAFVPVVRESKYAALLAQAGGKAGRAGVRFGVGALEGAAGATALEPIIAGARFQELADYHATDSLLNIAFGTVFGGGLHAVTGGIGDALNKAKPSEVIAELAASREAPSQFPTAATQAAPVSAIEPDKLPALGRDASQTDAYIEQAANIRRQLIAARLGDSNDPDALAKVLGQKPKSLAQFIRDTGGIVAQGGELEARDISNRLLPGLVRKNTGANPGAAGWDAVRERAFDAGYFPQKSSYDDISDSELIDAIATDLGGSRVWPYQAQDAVLKMQQAEQFIDDLARNGIAPDMTEVQIATRLRELDDEARASQAEELGIDLDLLREYDQSAAREVEAASEPQRGAALRVAVAQAVEGRPIQVEGTLRNDLEQIKREAAPRIEDDPTVDVRAAEQADADIASVPGNDDAELADLERAVAEANEQAEAFRVDAEAAGLDAELPADLRAELAAVEAYEKELANTAEIARRAAICAMRSA